MVAAETRHSSSPRPPGAGEQQDETETRAEEEAAREAEVYRITTLREYCGGHVCGCGHPDLDGESQEGFALTVKEFMEMAEETRRRTPHILEPPPVLLAIKDAPLEARCPEDISEHVEDEIGVDVKSGAVGLTSSQTRRGHLVEP